MSKVEKLVVRAALRVVKLDSIRADPSYQRDIKSSHKKIIANFEPHALGIPLLGERDDGSLWVVDGLQRITALKALGKTEVRAEVFHSSGPEHEAKIFVFVNGNRTKLNSCELFFGRLCAGDEVAWELKKCVEERGYSIPKKTRAGQNAKALLSPRLMYDIVKDHGTDSIKWLLGVIDKAWPGDPVGIKEGIIGGMALFYRRRDGQIDTDKLVRNLSTSTPTKLIYSASLGVGDRSSTIADVLEKFYRKRARR